MFCLGPSPRSRGGFSKSDKDGSLDLNLFGSVKLAPLGGGKINRSGGLLFSKGTRLMEAERHYSPSSQICDISSRLWALRGNCLRLSAI